MFEALINILINFGPKGLAIAAFIEPIFMPFPMEIIFIPVSIANPQMAIFFSLIMIVFSTLGSVIGYKMGDLFGSSLLSKFTSESSIKKIHNSYNKNAALTIITSSFTPIPFEVYVLSAGTFRINFLKFIITAIISRIIRYVPQGILIYLYGNSILSLMQRYIIIIGFVIFIVFLIFQVKFKKAA